MWRDIGRGSLSIQPRSRSSSASLCASLTCPAPLDEGFDLIPMLALMRGEQPELLRGIGLGVGGMTLPLMRMDYLGSITGYLTLPFMTVFGSGVAATVYSRSSSPASRWCWPLSPAGAGLVIGSRRACCSGGQSIVHLVLARRASPSPPR